MSALLSFCFYEFKRKHIGSASSLAASRNAHKGMVQGPNGLNFPRARSPLGHSNLVSFKKIS